ncbi:hypothetical protein [Algoriphagus sp. AK58]|uniref:hypothetical protein n=1 Tax=Algoriphagus sp. AK58 TaxID=1406877 RepID=UPI001650B5E1|nr:hypothetical protein [Algoriphagus sp. AK58]MBC6366949.1 hypothetical protein [Algoriphagus sp. AK58]
MKTLIWIPVVFLMSFSCMDSEDVNNSDLGQLELLEKEIIALSESVPCTNSTEWKFTPMGSKSCGGPLRYIAFHQSVEKRFLELVDQYTFQQQEYNRRNNAISDCMLVGAPRAVTCEGGKPIFVY